MTVAAAGASCTNSLRLQKIWKYSTLLYIFSNRFSNFADCILWNLALSESLGSSYVLISPRKNHAFPKVCVASGRFGIPGGEAWEGAETEVVEPSQFRIVVETLESITLTWIVHSEREDGSIQGIEAQTGLNPCSRSSIWCPSIFGKEKWWDMYFKISLWLAMTDSED
jgi:hypothetical protein